MHLPLLELTPKLTHPHTWGLVFLLVVPFNEKEGVGGGGMTEKYFP